MPRFQGILLNKLLTKKMLDPHTKQARNIFSSTRSLSHYARSLRSSPRSRALSSHKVTKHSFCCLTPLRILEAFILLSARTMPARLRMVSEKYISRLLISEPFSLERHYGIKSKERIFSSANDSGEGLNVIPDLIGDLGFPLEFIPAKAGAGMTGINSSDQVIMSRRKDERFLLDFN